jgi:hypothetical protein
LFQGSSKLKPLLSTKGHFNAFIIASNYFSCYRFLSEKNERRSLSTNMAEGHHTNTTLGLLIISYYSKDV